MKDNLVKKGMAFAIIILFVGAGITQIVTSKSIVAETKNSIDYVNHDKLLPSNGLFEWFIKTFFPHINGTGKTSEKLDEFQGWKFVLMFEFTNPEAVMYLDWLDIPLCTLRGEGVFRAVLFYGYVEEISPGEYHIDGNCIQIAYKSPDDD